jgi:hypothetical protein
LSREKQSACRGDGAEEIAMVATELIPSLHHAHAEVATLHSGCVSDC